MSKLPRDGWIDGWRAPDQYDIEYDLRWLDESEDPMFLAGSRVTDLLLLVRHPLYFASAYARERAKVDFGR